LLSAILWDVDGTLAETERDGHLVAFNQAAAECRGALAVGPSLGRIEGWSPPADAGSKRIGLDQISRWYAHSVWAQ